LATGLEIGAGELADVAFGRKWERLARELGPERPFHVLLIGVQRRGDLRHRRRVPERGGELLAALAELPARPLPRAPGPPHRRSIPEMTADLALDGRRGKRGEPHPPTLVQA